MAFEYRPYANPYVGSMIDLMGRGEEARSRAELSAAEIEAGAQRRLGDITGAQWSGLGNTIGQGIDAYVTEQREAPLRKHAALMREEDLARIAREKEARERRQQAQALGGRVMAGLEEWDSPIGPMLAFETDDDGKLRRTSLGSAPPPSRFRGDAPPGTERDAAGNFVRGEPALLPAQTLAMDPSPYKTRDSRGLELYDLEKVAQQAFLDGVYEEFSPFLQSLEGFNTRRVQRFDMAYQDFHDTLKGSLGQPQALMSVAAELFPTFSQELGGSPRFQALLQNFERAQETGDPNVFQTAVRRDTDTPIDAPIQPYPDRPELDPWSGERIAAAQGPPITARTGPLTVVTESGKRITGATQAVVGGDTIQWYQPSGAPWGDDDPVARVVSDTGGLSYTARLSRWEAERKFPSSLRMALGRDWRTGDVTYEQAIEKVKRFIREVGTTDQEGADRMDPAIIIAYTRRLYGKPLTAEQQFLADTLQTVFQGLQQPPATGAGE
jgi:hypothetical protein